MFTLMIVDDEQEIRNGLSQYFPWEELGFKLTHACSDGQQAIDFLEQHPIDVVLSDIRMPVLSGIELAKTIHERKWMTKVIFMSGYRDFEYAKQALLYQVKNYIVKPTKYDELYTTFRDLAKDLQAERGSSLAPDTSSHQDAGSIDHQVIEQIKAYVQNHFATATLDEAAKRVYMNPFYVSKYFKDRTGQNFSDYVLSIKMEEAARLLMDIQYKTYHVSEMVGYTNAKNFARSFRKYFGISPREYRQARKLPDDET